MCAPLLDRMFATLAFYSPPKRIYTEATAQRGDSTASKLDPLLVRLAFLLNALRFMAYGYCI